TIHSRDEKPDDILEGDRHLVVEFQDTGVGIEPSMLGRIFEPFEQGSAARLERCRGLGLGLAISLKVAEAHGGCLTASSVGRGLGSTFRLELPAVPAPRTNPSKTPPAEPSSRLPGHLRILLVEDNADTLRYLGMVLQQQGNEVTSAAQLSAARKAASAGE